MIFAILFLALLLRLINLNQSLWLDEAVQAITARGSFSSIFSEIVGDFHPPLYHFLMHFWVGIFGSSEIALRAPSVLFGLGAVWFIYLIGKTIGSNKTALWAAVFLTTSPFNIYYSQEARMYAMACFLATASFYFLLKTDKTKKNSFLYFLFTVLLLYTDYYGFLVLLAQSIYFLIKRKFKFLLVAYCLLLITYSPWLPMLITQLKTGMAATLALPSWGKLVNLSFFKAIPLTLIKFTIGRITIFNKTLYATVGGLIILLNTLLILKAYLKKKDSLVFLWFLVPLIVSWLVSLIVPNFQPFRLLLILPSFYLLLVLGIESFKTKFWQRFLITLFLLINLVCLSVYFFNPYFQREDWRGTVNFLSKQKALILLPSQTSSWPIKYYDPSNQINFMTIGKGVETIKEVAEIKEEKIIFINYLTSVFDPDNLIITSLQEQGYNRVKEINFNQINLIEFQK